MRALIQRCAESTLRVDGEIFSSINKGLLVLIGIEVQDSQEDIDWLVGKISKLRVFDDADGVMNLSVEEISGEVMIVSQFTLHASTKKGNRPSYIKAAKSEVAIPLYKQFIATMEKQLNKSVAMGKFGSEMKISFTNDGPVTIWIDSKNRE